MNLATTLHDPEGSMLQQAKRVLPRVATAFGRITVAMTETTHTEWTSLLSKSQIAIVSGGMWNEGRKHALADLVEKDKESLIALFDFDKILHIFDIYENEFVTFLQKTFDDAVILGRSEKAWSTYPDSWIETEGIANRLANMHFQTPHFDYIVGAWMLSPMAAKLLTEQSVNKGFDAAFEYVQIFKKAKIAIDYLEADFLDWEDPDRNQKEIGALGFAIWKQQRFEGLYEWKKRIKNLADLVSPLQ